MAINIHASHNNFPLRIRYYPHKYFNDDTVLKDTKKVKGVLYARKYGNTKTYSYITQSGLKTQRTEMQLLTPDYVNNLELDDFIIYRGKKWLVVALDDVEVEEHKGKSISEDVIITVRS